MPYNTMLHPLATLVAYLSKASNVVQKKHAFTTNYSSSFSRKNKALVLFPLFRLRWLLAHWPPGILLAILLDGAFCGQEGVPADDD